MHLGIDFGTSYTKMGCLNNGQFVNLAGLEQHIPSVAAYSSLTGKLYFGNQALQMDDNDVEKCFFFKLALKRNPSFKLGPYHVSEIIQQFFMYLREHYLAPQSLQVDSAAISAPNYFGLNARRALIQATRKAFQIADVILLPEPIAALTGYRYNNPDHALAGCILVADIGGGTTDFSFVDIVEDGREILLESQFQMGHDAFSGSEVDKTILNNILLPLYEMIHGEPIAENILSSRSSHERQLINRWMREAEKIKIAVSEQGYIHALIPDFYQGLSIYSYLDKSFVYEQTLPVFNRLQSYCQDTLYNKAISVGLADTHGWNFDHILLIGGGSHIYGVHNLFQNCFSNIEFICPNDSEFYLLTGLCVWKEYDSMLASTLRTLYPFNFYLKTNDTQNGETTLTKIPFDTANLELDYYGSYKLLSLPSQSPHNYDFQYTIFESEQGEGEIIEERFIGMEPVLQIKPDNSGENIDIYLDMKECRLLTGETDLPSSPARDTRAFDHLLKSQISGLTLVNKYKYFPEDLARDYENHLNMLRQEDKAIEHHLETIRFKLLAMLHLL